MLVLFNVIVPCSILCINLLENNKKRHLCSIVHVFIFTILKAKIIGKTFYTKKTIGKTRIQSHQTPISLNQIKGSTKILETKRKKIN